VTASALYEGGVRHRRFAPRRHTVRAGLYLLLLDHDELDRADGPLRPGGPLGPERWWPAHYRRTDYLDGDAAVPLGDAVRDLVADRTGVRPDGPVQTHTQVRTEGYVFNPLTVHYCLAPGPVGPGGRRALEVVVLEVTNTPWHERHCYVVDARPAAAATGPDAVAVGHTDARGRVHATMPKALHVSPFMGMDQTYRLTCTPPGERLWLRLENVEHGSRVFDADLALRRRPLTRRELLRQLVARPLLTYRVWAGIHAHAVALAARRVPFVAHPQRAGRTDRGAGVPAGGRNRRA
jgi:DUF1365 family protein